MSSKLFATRMYVPPRLCTMLTEFIHVQQSDNGATAECTWQCLRLWRRRQKSLMSGSHFPTQFTDIQMYTHSSPPACASTLTCVFKFTSIVIGSLVFMLWLAKLRLRSNVAERAVIVVRLQLTLSALWSSHWHTLWPNESALKFSNFVFFIYGRQWNFRVSCVAVDTNIHMYIYLRSYNNMEYIVFCFCCKMHFWILPRPIRLYCNEFTGISCRKNQKVNHECLYFLNSTYLITTLLLYIHVYICILMLVPNSMKLWYPNAKKFWR